MKGNFVLLLLSILTSTSQGTLSYSGYNSGNVGNPGGGVNSLFPLYFDSGCSTMPANTSLIDLGDDNANDVYCGATNCAFSYYAGPFGISYYANGAILAASYWKLGYKLGYCYDFNIDTAYQSAAGSFSCTKDPVTGLYASHACTSLPPNQQYNRLDVFGQNGCTTLVNSYYFQSTKALSMMLPAYAKGNATTASCQYVAGLGYARFNQFALNYFGAQNVKTVMGNNIYSTTTTTTTTLPPTTTTQSTTTTTREFQMHNVIY